MTTNSQLNDTAEVQEMHVFRDQILAAERAVEDADRLRPRPFGSADRGATHLQAALAALRLARVYADAYVDVARQDAGLPR